MTQPLLLSFHVHAFDVHFDLAIARQAFATIRELGGNSVRTDLSWFDIEPQMGRWDEERIAWYKNYYDHAAQAGLRPIVVLFGLPAWATELYRKSASAFLYQWEMYCRRVAEMTNGNVRLFQVWNEPNSPVYGTLKLNHYPNVLHIAREMLEHALGRVEIAINLAADIPYWEKWVSFLIEKAGAAFDIIGIDHFPGTWTLTDAKDWHVLRVLMRRTNDPADAWFGKKPALMEIGYSSFLPVFRNEAAQRNWIETALPEIYRICENGQHPIANELRILNWYKLFDDHQEPAHTPLRHFGLLHALREQGMLIPKLGLDAMRAQFARLSDPRRTFTHNKRAMGW